MRYKLSVPSAVKATIQLPASKSISNRALILNALAQGTTPPCNLSDCDDTLVMIKALDGNNETIDIMAAGTAMRFLTAYLSTTPGTHILTGTERMQQRPIQILVNALRELGAQIDYVNKEGYPPLRIHGKELTGNEITLKGNVSSQYISALLMIGPVLKNGLRLHLSGEIISRPYINLTLQLSEKAEIELIGLFPNSYQGDSRGAEIFARLGVETEFIHEGVLLKKNGTLPERLDENFIDIPDLAQTFAVTCCLLGIPFRFTGLQSLKIKETDRIAALENELYKLGYILCDKQDSILCWEGERCEPEAEPVINTYEDHRMAMAFAPAAVRFPKMRIADPQVVTKSYPSYWENLKQAGFKISIEQP